MENRFLNDFLIDELNRNDPHMRSNCEGGIFLNDNPLRWILVMVVSFLGNSII